MARFLLAGGLLVLALTLQLNAVESSITFHRPRRQAPQEGPDVLKFFSELGPQVEKAQSSAKMFTSLFGTNQAPPASDPNQQASSLNSALQTTQLMSSLSNMLRSAQSQGAGAASGAQQAVQATAQQLQQQSAAAAQNAQGGIQSALVEIGEGLKKIASNNPSLIPDVKNLYNSVSTKLSSASSSVQQASNPLSGPIVPAKTADQLVDNLGKVALMPTT